ncbi:ATP-grasp domain-containing protein [Saccharibacillus sp. CPCC 101409]|uniref:ATP-grasp domain-containing protein n=1 Tax=Saccharibacillus sp. CPCC 101409 TaxID=3058041 RepID=UPI002673F109|nr:ATP-grasp domain-containing protein [Saccharibacillus sp. CPCC 101409]MDO3408527.1 ATP-grasp domain-containing protein [Saccharibacillus sp. CPCC 101409]
MKKIWLNRWFSVAYHYVNLIRGNEDGKQFVFYGTHPNIDHVSLSACDFKETEPEVEGEEYIRFCLDFCKRNGIDLFIPRLHMELIAHHLDRFEEIGTRVMVCGNIELLESMMNKEKFYLSLEGKGVVDIPEYRVVNTAEGFADAYRELSQSGSRVCFKPTESEGGMGFRIIKEGSGDPLKELYGWVTLETTFDEAYRTLSSVERFDDLMVMEMLEDEEYSIDCLADAEGRLLTAIPRRKSEGRVYHLEQSGELLALSNRIAENCRIPYAFNIQVKYNKGVPKLLEINPRMSGGLYITCLSGVNIPYLAVQAAFGEECRPPEPEFGIKASYVEQAVRLDRFSPESGTPQL